jgi:hypothetical protein
MKISVDQLIVDPTASQTQPRELARVNEKIEDLVYSFCRDRVRRVFHMPELESYVRRFKKISPGSGSRILRKLRSEGRLTYDVINRRKSAYIINQVMEGK